VSSSYYFSFYNDQPNGVMNGDDGTTLPFDVYNLYMPYQGTVSVCI